MKDKMKGFTLVELLAVIVILAIILVIAVPKVMSVIEDSKKATLESTAKMIASSAEKAKVQNTVLGKTDDISCDSVAKLNDIDYEDCDIDFDGNTAKVTIKGSGKFAGLNICGGTKNNASATEESCTLVSLTVDTDGGTDDVEYNPKYEAGSNVTLTEPTKDGYTFVNWVVESGEGAVVNGNTLKMGITATKVKATWEKEQTPVTVGEFRTDSWETIVAAVKQAYNNGTEYPYNVGDEKTIEIGTLGTHTIRVANKTKCSALETETLSKSACGFVLEFADIITPMKMRDTSTTAGGWPATNVRTYLNNENDETSLYNLLPTELSGGIINTYVVSGRGKDDTSGNLDDDNFGYDDKIYLLSTYEVWGSNSGGYDLAATDTITRQLDYYADNEVTTTDYGDAIKNYQGSASIWRLRSAYSNNSDSFYCVATAGRWTYADASNSYGLAPAFRLAD